MNGRCESSTTTFLLTLAPMDDNCSLKLGRSEGRVVERIIIPPRLLLLLLLLLFLAVTVACMVDDPSEAPKEEAAVTATMVVG